MGSARPWQIILFVLALLVLSGGLFLSCRGGVHLADSILMVDVKTGDRFRFDTSGRKGVGVPAKHPDTGIRTLLPIIERDGNWLIATRYRIALESMEDDVVVVDYETFQVTLSDASIRAGKK